MNTIKIKEKLIEEIKQVEDINLLESLYAMLQGENDSEIYQLSEEQLAAIEEAEEQIRNGNYFSHEEILKEFQKWREE